MARPARDRAHPRGVTMLVVEIEKQLGDFAVDAAFESESGATALFGPSGAGKTTSSI